MIDYATKDQVKRQLSLPELVKDYLKPGTSLKQVSQNTWQCRCPNPSHEDSTPSFEITYDPKFGWTWCCWGCHHGIKGHGNYGTDCFAFVQWITQKTTGRSVSFPEAVRICAAKAGIKMSEENYKDKVTKWQFNLYKSQEALRYLADRGIDGVSAYKYKLGYDPDKRRIIIPVFQDGRIVGTTSRSIDPGVNPKYVHSSGLPRNALLFGSLTESQKVYIVEGPFDVIMATQYGYKNVVATLGGNMSDIQADIILQHGSPVLVYDGDKAGQNYTQESLLLFARKGVLASYIVLPDNTDPCELLPSERQLPTERVLREKELLLPIIQQFIQLKQHLEPEINSILNQSENKEILETLIETCIGRLGP